MKEFEATYGMHWTQASNLLLEYYNKYQQKSEAQWDAEEERIDYSCDTSVRTIETECKSDDKYLR